MHLMSLVGLIEHSFLTLSKPLPVYVILRVVQCFQRWHLASLPQCTFCYIHNYEDLFENKNQLLLYA